MSSSHFIRSFASYSFFYCTCISSIFISALLVASSSFPFLNLFDIPPGVRTNSLFLTSLLAAYEQWKRNSAIPNLFDFFNCLHLCIPGIVSFPLFFLATGI